MRPGRRRQPRRIPAFGVGHRRSLAHDPAGPGQGAACGAVATPQGDRDPHNVQASRAMRTLWGIRHVRWFWLLWRINVFWLSCGPGRWCPPDVTEAEALDRVWRGEA